MALPRSTQTPRGSTACRLAFFVAFFWASFAGVPTLTGDRNASVLPQPLGASAAYFYVQESQDKCFVESVPVGVALTVTYKNPENPASVSLHPLASFTSSLRSPPSLVVFRRHLQHHFQGSFRTLCVQQRGSPDGASGENLAHDGDGGRVQSLHFLRLFQMVQHSAAQVVHLHRTRRHRNQPRCKTKKTPTPA
ncbi:transmembrane protein [Toxoplasma gondii RUB]|uniref:Transmembrane protein n=2 Tax=Toxoplasma gondii TaxID=5811 RepID=A0A086LJU7_TOXGO|nr:transmembrane protein [Toxoplasma gondii RUB]RQX70653.1 putative transmembrane protein [Toxoplasma gondii CAST]